MTRSFLFFNLFLLLKAWVFVLVHSLPAERVQGVAPFSIKAFVVSSSLLSNWAEEAENVNPAETKPKTLQLLSDNLYFHIAIAAPPTTTYTCSVIGTLHVLAPPCADAQATCPPPTAHRVLFLTCTHTFCTRPALHLVFARSPTHPVPGLFDLRQLHAQHASLSLACTAADGAHAATAAVVRFDVPAPIPLRDADEVRAGCARVPTDVVVVPLGLPVDGVRVREMVGCVGYAARGVRPWYVAKGAFAVPGRLKVAAAVRGTWSPFEALEVDAMVIKLLEKQTQEYRWTMLSGSITPKFILNQEIHGKIDCEVKLKLDFTHIKISSNFTKVTIPLLKCDERSCAAYIASYLVRDYLPSLKYVLKDQKVDLITRCINVTTNVPVPILAVKTKILLWVQDPSSMIEKYLFGELEQNMEKVESTYELAEFIPFEIYGPDGVTESFSFGNRLTCSKDDSGEEVCFYGPFDLEIGAFATDPFEEEEDTEPLIPAKERKETLGYLNDESAPPKVQHLPEFIRLFGEGVPSPAPSAPVNPPMDQARVSSKSKHPSGEDDTISKSHTSILQEEGSSSFDEMPLHGDEETNTEMNDFYETLHHQHGLEELDDFTNVDGFDGYQQLDLHHGFANSEFSEKNKPSGATSFEK